MVGKNNNNNNKKTLHAFTKTMIGNACPATLFFCHEKFSQRHNGHNHFIF